jgi:hypothetical protein
MEQHSRLVAQCVMVLGCGGLAVDGPDATGVDGEVLRAGQVSVAALSDASCTEDWQVLVDGEPGSIVPSSLVRWERELVVDVGNPLSGSQQLLLSSLDAPGRTRTLDPGLFSQQIWVEAEHLMLWGQGRLVRLLPADGIAELDFDVGGGGPNALLGPALLGPDELLWTQSDGVSALGLWRHDRATGQSELLASLDANRFLQPPLSRTPDSVLVAAQRGPDAVIPLTGDGQLDVQEVPGGELVGVGSRGSYYSRVANRTRRGGRADRVEILQSPVDGSQPARIWRGNAGQFIDSLWEVDGAWLGVGRYFLPDGRAHAVVVAINASGRSRVVACNPGPEELRLRPVVFEDQLYAVGVDSGAWRIMATPVQGVGSF